MSHQPQTRSQLAEAAENVGRNGSDNPTIGDIIAARYGRRDLLKGALGVAAIAATVSPLALLSADPVEAGLASRFDFAEVTAGTGETHVVADGYDADILIRWGDPVLAGAPAFDPAGQSTAAQKRQFGYNNDFLAYFPLPGANPSRHGLLVVNHEYTNEELMFPGLGPQEGKTVDFAGMTAELTGIEMAAHGGSVIEVARGGDGKWAVVPNSKYARRIDLDTEMDITGPAAGDDRLKTTADVSGCRVFGMLNNCAGGVTPWGTWLTCEENINGYFLGQLAKDHREATNFKRYGIPGNAYGWGKFHDRFNLAKEPQEANRFGWVVEIDPFDPNSTPKKRTALGRMKHEGAAGVVNADGRYVVYLGDDERFDYVYRFVTSSKVDRADPRANRDLLDAGTLSVARYNADGSLDWLPLTHGSGPLTAANGFASQADVLIETRRAADLVGATKMDRPEDVEANPVSGKVYVVLTNNTHRKAGQTDAANPRGNNAFGHIIEMIPPGGDHAADRFGWGILLKCGDPSVAAVGASFSPETSKSGWFGMPDNLAFDSAGRMWIATDGNSANKTGRSDGLWGVETDGPARATSKHFFRVPVGAEMCGPVFTPDDETLFVAVQHPGESDDSDPQAPAATFERPATRWPDFKPGMPPRPSVIAITKRGGGKIAG